MSVISILISILLLSQHSAQASCLRQVYNYPPGTWIENIAVRKNGFLVLTSINHPAGLQQLNPFGSSSPTPLIDKLPGNATFGIVEAEHDVFYFINADFNFGVPFGTTPGTNAIWKYDFNTNTYEKVQALPQAGTLNGLTKFNNTLLLAGDSSQGLVYGVNLVTNTSYVLAKDSLMAPVMSSDGLREGVNGLKFLNDHQGGKLFFINTQRHLYNVLELDANARPVGKAKVIAEALEEKDTPMNWDDFALDSHGNAYIATQIGNSIQRVAQDGRIRIVAGNINSTDILEPSSAAFGRLRRDKHILYVTTAGGLAFPAYVNGTAMRRGAQVVAVDTRRL